MPKRNTDPNSPSAETITPEARTAKGKEKTAISEAALDKVHTLVPNDGWKKQQKLWSEADDELRKSYLYGMVLNDGAMGNLQGRKRIAAFFAVKLKDLEQYKDVIEMADAARVLKINRNQLAISLLRDDQPTYKFHMGKQFAYQVNDPVHEGVENADASKNELTIKVIGNEPDTAEGAGSVVDDIAQRMGFTMVTKDRTPS